MIQLARLDVVSFPCWPLPTHDVPEDERRRLKRTFDGLGAADDGDGDELLNRTVFHPIARVHEFASAPCEALSLRDILGDLPKFHMAPPSDAREVVDGDQEIPSRAVVWDDANARVVGYPTPSPLVQQPDFIDLDLDEPVVLVVSDGEDADVDADEEEDVKAGIVVRSSVSPITKRRRLRDLDHGRYVTTARTAFQVRRQICTRADASQAAARDARFWGLQMPLEIDLVPHHFTRAFKPQSMASIDVLTESLESKLRLSLDDRFTTITTQCACAYLDHADLRQRTLATRGKNGCSSASSSAPRPTSASATSPSSISMTRPSPSGASGGISPRPSS